MTIRQMRSAAIVVSTLVALSACTPTTSPTMSPSAQTMLSPTVSTPSASPTPTWSADQLEAVAVVGEYYVIYNEVLRHERNPNDLATVARRDALADAQRTYNELGNAKLTVTGGVVVSGLVPSAIKKNGRLTVAVALCEDTTEREVLDESGKNLSSGAVSPVTATLQQWDDGWFVTDFAKGKRSC